MHYNYAAYFACLSDDVYVNDREPIPTEYKYRRKKMRCDECAYYEYDEEDEQYYCSVDMDEDDYYRFITGKQKECMYYRNGDEYAVVKHQM